ncbi:hypothetical protein OCU04_008038 [Sclerotinia nivalis]|uniref:N-acetyltransferase domain-containing protein n=1 Tax=Sclerotinia nivalis TaxID=352851 RepID=A0A9X0AH90_9HELO|nr:hypothetical protein OCU04_008038 [Sclerotinia nivalis]
MHFRRRGAATQLVKWGVEKADELDMTSLLDAAPVEKVLYERLGFVVQEEFVMNFSKENPGAVWEKLEKECLPHVTLLMIRSKEGV